MAQQTTMSSSPTDSTKFLYVRDPDCPEHVLTVARRIVGTEVHITYCANKAVVSKVAYQADKYEPKTIICDRFEKARARKITLARFNHPIRVIKLPYTKGEVITDILKIFAQRGHYLDNKFIELENQIPETLSQLASRALLVGRTAKMMRKRR